MRVDFIAHIYMRVAVKGLGGGVHSNYIHPTTAFFYDDNHKLMQTLVHLEALSRFSF